MDQSLTETAPVAQWNYDMVDCPQGKKVLLLTHKDIAVIGHIGSPADYKAWSPLPKRNKRLEIERGIF